MPQNKFQGHIFLYKKGVEGAFFIVFFSRIDFSAVLFFLRSFVENTGFFAVFNPLRIANFPTFCQ